MYPYHHQGTVEPARAFLAAAAVKITLATRTPKGVILMRADQAGGHIHI